MGLRQVAYAWYARRVRAALPKAAMPRHVAVVMDGNRRWARQQGYDNVSVGHQHGAEHVEDLLDWCRELGIDYVTVFVASADNLVKRDTAEVDVLMQLVERVVADRVVNGTSYWRVHVAGRRELLPDSTSHALKLAEESTRERSPGHLTLAIAYDGRSELVDAVRTLLVAAAETGVGLAELATTLRQEDIAQHLYTSGQPDPELLIRTSGEMRLSNFLLWQAADAQLWFCEVYWPGFRQVDFLRALRSYAARRSSGGDER